MVDEQPVKLPDPYISVKLDESGINHVLTKVSLFVAYEMYLIRNGLKRRYDYLTIPEDSNLNLDAYVVVSYAFIGDAKSQAWNIKPISKLLKKKPKYSVVCELSQKSEYNKYLYKFRFESTRKKSIYKMIEESKAEIKKIFDEQKNNSTLHY
jgi:hypothetical protein